MGSLPSDFGTVWILDLYHGDRILLYSRQKIEEEDFRASFVILSISDDFFGFALSTALFNSSAVMSQFRNVFGQQPCRFKTSSNTDLQHRYHLKSCHQSLFPFSKLPSFCFHCHDFLILFLTESSLTSQDPNYLFISRIVIQL